MIRCLRIKFICITMAIVTVMLTLLLATQYRSTQNSLERASLTALESAAREPMSVTRPAFGDMERDQPCFSLSLSAWGTLRASGSSYYDLSDEAVLLTIYQAALADGGSSGVLAEYALRYYRSEGPLELRYVFTDISGEVQTLRELLRSSLAVGCVGFFGFLILSILLANWAIRPVEQAWEQQRQFVADASHELKTPLTVILTNAELLREPEYGEPQRQQFVDSILTMSHQMRGLVESMLQLARADSGQTDAPREKLDLSRLLEQTVLPFEPLYFEQGLLLESQIHPGVTLAGDAAQLRQVAEILLDNALKYAAPGGTVRFELQGRGRECCLTVASPGQPLSPQQCRDIFRRFYRVDQARSRNGSYGLGLAIARRIVSDHRGKIWAESRDGVNRFYVTLPTN